MFFTQCNHIRPAIRKASANLIPMTPTPLDVQAASSRAFAAENAGPDILYNPERFDRQFGRGAFAQTHSPTQNRAPAIPHHAAP
jgi:hypothetical protein